MMNYGYSQELEQVIQLPEGFSVESFLEKPMNIETDFGRYSLELEHMKNTLIIKRKPIREAGGGWQNVARSSVSF